MSEVIDLPVGYKIRFETPEGYYEGDIRSSTRSGFIEVDSWLLPDEDFLGKLRFHYSEILSYQILDSSRAETNAANPFARVPCKLSSADAFDISDDDLDAVSVSYEDPGLAEETFSFDLPPAFSHLSPDLAIIDKSGENFESAMAHLNDEPVIGITLEGDALGRYGTLSWLCVSTSKITYLFDLYGLGYNIFDQGMRDVMQDTNIVKVIHDCRLVSDMLLHKYGTRLVNVFDTQVADKYVETQRKGPGSVNLHVSSLNCCLRNYLNIPEEFLYRPVNRRLDHLLYQRPPCVKILELMMKNVIYLRSLKEKLEECMLEQFYEAVEISLQTLPSATDEELLLGLYDSERLPADVNRKGIKTIRSNHNPEEHADVNFNPIESKRSMDHKFSEWNGTDSCEVNETLPSKSTSSENELPTSTIETSTFVGGNHSPNVSIIGHIRENCEIKSQKCSPTSSRCTNSENELPSCTNRSNELDKVNPSPYVNISDQTGENCEFQSGKCSETSKNAMPESVIEKFRFRGIRSLPFFSNFKETADNRDVQLLNSLQTSNSAMDSKFQGINDLHNCSTSNETAEGDVFPQKCYETPKSNCELLKFREIKCLPDSSNSEEGQKDETSKNAVPESVIEKFRFRGMRSLPFFSNFKETADNRDVQPQSSLQASDSAMDTLKFQGINISHNISSNETAEEGDVFPQKYFESHKSACEFQKFKGLKYLPNSSQSEVTGQNGSQQQNSLQTSSVSSIPSVFDYIESDNSGNKFSFSDSSESESDEGLAFDSFSCRKSSEYIYSEEGFTSEKKSKPCDPWERLRAEISEHLSPIENNMNVKRRLVPAGQQNY